MEYYLDESLSRADRDTQIMFHWPELWTTYNRIGWHCYNTFTGLGYSGVKSACHAAAFKFGFKSWQIEWTGWKRLPNSDVLVCQWVAYSQQWHEWHLYSSYPGACGPFVPGSVFDISFRDGQGTPSVRSSDETLHRMSRQCLYMLLVEIARIGEPPYDPPWRRQ